MTVDPTEHSYKFFDNGWDISKNKANVIENEIRMRRNTIKGIEKKISNSEE